MKKFLIAAAIVATPVAANAGVSIVETEQLFKQVPITETVQVCEKVKDRTTEGAILGGLIGSKDGNALAGALIGGLLGDAAGGHQKCHTETRTIGHRSVADGYRVVIEVDGDLRTMILR